MLIDLLSQSNYYSYNYILANILGLEESIYINVILSINNKAIKKSKLENTYIRVDRKFIENVTTLTENKQHEIDKALKELNIIKLDEKDNNLIELNIDTLAAIFSVDTKNINTLPSLTKNKKRSKSDVIIDNLKSSIVCNNVELREAYDGWIDGVYANPKGFLSKRAVKIAQQLVDEFSNHDLDVALAIIDIAAVNGYRDMQWAINKYVEENKRKTYKINKPTSVNSDVELSNEVF